MSEVASESDKRWAEENCLEGNETKEDPKHFFFIGNVTYSKTGSKGKKKALIVVGKYRLFVCNKGKIKKRSLSKTLHLFDLQEIVGGREAATFAWYKKNTLNNKDGTLSLDIRAQCLPYLVQAIRTSLMRIAPNFSPQAAFKLLIHENDLLPVKPLSDVGPAGGILDTYKAYCDYEKAPASVEFEKYIMGLTCYQLPTYELNLNEVPGIEPKSDISLSIGPLMMALRHNAYFRSLRLAGIAHKNMPSLLAGFIRFNRTVTRLEMIHTDFSSQNMEAISHAIVDNLDSQLQMINFSGNNIGTGGGIFLAQALQSLKHSLPYLDLSGCNMGPKAIVDLFLAFQRNFGMSLTIRTLNLSKNKFEDLGSDMFAQWLTVCRERSPLQRIILSKAHINFITISAPLRYLKNLQELDISYNKLDHAACQLLRTVVETTPTLHVLNVSHCKLEGEHAALIVKAMVTNAACSETRINMGYNKLNTQDALAISAALRGNVNLRYFNLAGNKFKAKGLASIFHTLATCATLETLVLDDSCPSSSAELVESLTHLVNTTPALKALSLGGSFGKCLLGGFLVALKTNESLEEFSVEDNKLGDVGASLLGDVLSSNVFLQTLHIDGNQFTPSGFRCIKMGLSKNQSLKKMPFPWKDFQKASSAISYEPHLVAFRELVLDMQVYLMSLGSDGIPQASRFEPENKVATPADLVPLADVPEELQIIEQTTRLMSEGEQPVDGGYAQGGLAPVPVSQSAMDGSLFSHSQVGSQQPISRSASVSSAGDDNVPPLPPRDD